MKYSRRGATAVALSLFFAVAWIVPGQAADYDRPPAYATPDGVTLVHAGTLLAVPGEPPRAEQTVVVRDGSIERIADGFLQPEDIDEPEARLLDLSNSFVMPGFIDLHVHLSGQAGTGTRFDSVTMTDADVALRAEMYARRTLEAGFTTVRDLGSSGDSIFALRDAIEAGWVPGPKILVSGDTITPTGGHGDVHGLRADVAAVIASTGVCDGPDDCREAVRRQVKRGADVIKVTATGGVMSETSTGTGQQFTDEELRAIAEAAHALGRKVTAHAHGKGGIDAALRAGFDSIEHAMWADEDSMELFKQSDAWLVPTVYPITAVGDTPEKMKQGPFKDMPPPVMQKLLALGRQPKEMTALAYDVGVKIALGTDSGVSPHGENGHEFIEYVNAGMSEMEALMAGTVNAARAGGIAEEVGSLVPGKAADLVALPASPLDDIEAVLRPTLVMRDGVAFEGVNR